MFVEVLAAKLARNLTIPITDSRSLFNDMQILFTRLLAEATGIDGQEGTPDEIGITTFLDARH